MALIANRTKDHLNIRQLLVFSGSARAQRSALILHQTVFFELHALDALGPVEFNRRNKKARPNLPGGRALALGNLGRQDIHIALMHRLCGLRQELGIGLIKFEVFRLDDQIGDRHFRQFPNLGVGKGRLRRPPSAQQIDLLDRTFLERFECIVGDICF